MDNFEMRDEELNEVSGRIIGAAYAVSNFLGCGFLEKVYENALVHEMRKGGLHVEKQVALQVFYDGVVVGNYFADVIVENTIILELKVAEAIEKSHMSQALNYLNATGLPLCLILNFGTPKLGVKRVRL